MHGGTEEYEVIICYESHFVVSSNNGIGTCIIYFTNCSTIKNAGIDWPNTDTDTRIGPALPVINETHTYLLGHKLVDEVSMFRV